VKKALKGEEPTSLGSILLRWKIITKDQLSKALEQQETLRGDDLLGKLLVANGACTEDEIKTAVETQRGLRGSSNSKRAMAVADLAIERRSRKSLFDRRPRLEAQARTLERSITGDAHPAISATMLAAKPDPST
jgi:hypothetical protein